MNDESGVFKFDDEPEYLGFVQLPTVVLYDSRLSASHKLLYCIIRRYARQDDHCYPAVGRLSMGMGVSERVVQTQLSALESCGLITRQFRTGRSTVYKIARLEDVYCGEDRALTEKSIDMLRRAGEDRVADIVVARRSGVDLGDDSVSKNVATESKSEELPEKATKENLPAFEQVLGKVKDNQAKSDAFTDRRKKGQQKLAQDPTRQKTKILSPGNGSDGPMLTVRDVETAFRLAAQEVWPDVSAAWAPWTPAHMGIVKSLCNRFGHELVIQVLTEVVCRWDDYVNRFDLTGYPNVNLVASFADSWFPEVQAGKEIDPLPKRARARKEREYNESASSEDGGITFIGD